MHVSVTIKIVKLTVYGPDNDINGGVHYVHCGMGIFSYKSRPPKLKY